MGLCPQLLMTTCMMCQTLDTLLQIQHLDQEVQESIFTNLSLLIQRAKRSQGLFTPLFQH